MAVGRIDGRSLTVASVSGFIGLGGDVIVRAGDATFDGPVSLTRPIRVDSSAGGGRVTFTSTVDGRRPLAVAAGTGAVSFEGTVGATRPLAGLRFEMPAR